MGEERQLLKMYDRVPLTGDVGAHVYKLEDTVAQLKAALSVRHTTAIASSASITAASIRELVKFRRARNDIFGDELFFDPAWDILLEAFAAHLAQQRISVSSLCFGAAVPQTTALRWINKLEKDGWLIRRSDPHDGRRWWIELSENGADALDKYFAKIPPGKIPI